MAKNNFKTSIESNSSSTMEFYDAETTDDSDTFWASKNVKESNISKSSDEVLKAEHQLRQKEPDQLPNSSSTSVRANERFFTPTSLSSIGSDLSHDLNNHIKLPMEGSMKTEDDKGEQEQNQKEQTNQKVLQEQVTAKEGLITTNSLSNVALSQDPIWRNHKKHIFILSEAGKPIYSLHGSEDKLAILFGVIQALVSFVENTQDVLTSVHARGIQFVFMVKSHLIFVACSRTNMSVAQLQMQLNDVHNQILSTLTFSQLSKIFQLRKNFDLRRLLEGSERLINNLLLNDSSNKKVTNNVFTFLTNSIRCLPMPLSTRSSIVSAIKDYCGKIKNLVFAVMIANNRLICLVRLKKYSLQQTDLRLIMNLIDSTESFKTSENWTPICLPKFDMNGYLHAHVSYLEDDCPACLLLLTVDRDDFFTLSSAKKSISEKLKRTQCLEAISESVKELTNPKQQLNPHNIGLPELRHFIYKPKSTAQVLCSELVPPYTSLKEFERLEAIYCELLERVYHSARPMKLIFEAKSSEVILAWSTATYELYAVFEPLTKKSTVIRNVDKLIKWIEKEYDTYFIRNHPTF